MKARGGCSGPLATIVAFSGLGTPPPHQPTFLASAQATSSERASPIPCPPSLSVSLQWSSHSLRKKSKRTLQKKYSFYKNFWQIRNSSEVQQDLVDTVNCPRNIQCISKQCIVRYLYSYLIPCQIVTKSVSHIKGPTLVAI